MKKETKTNDFFFLPQIQTVEVLRYHLLFLKIKLIILTILPFDNIGKDENMFVRVPKVKHISVISKTSCEP